MKEVMNLPYTLTKTLEVGALGANPRVVGIGEKADYVGTSSTRPRFGHAWLGGWCGDRPDAGANLRRQAAERSSHGIDHAKHRLSDSITRVDAGVADQRAAA